MPAIMDSHGMDVGSASWLMSIFTFVGIFLAIPTGALAKKFGPKNMLLAAVGVLVIGTLVGAFASNGNMLVVSRAIEGVALIFCTVCGPLAVQKYVAPEKVGSATGIWAVWVCLGSFFGGVITPVLYDITGFQGVWFIFAALAVVAAILLFFFVRPVRGTVTEATSEVVDATSAPAKKVSYSQLIKPNTLLILAGFLIFNMVLLAMLGFAPTFFQEQGMDPTLSGFASTLPMLLAVISSPLFGTLADKTGKLKLLLIIAMAVMGPCVFLMLTNTGPLLWAAAIVMGLVGMGAPVMFLTTYPIAVGKLELMAIGMGLLMMIQSLGQFLGTAITPLVLESGWMATGIFALILGLAGTALLLFLKLPSKS